MRAITCINKLYQRGSFDTINPLYNKMETRVVPSSSTLSVGATARRNASVSRLT